ncbi:putative RNA-binding protein 46 [Caerostris extrusa]|uniref:RNA-binding protein 46 n=1 Tax=Caerostris extrusa TaxID=172846 RepID=A0AAV4PSX3_CAEEX|nr:putative RNA-binding protein 46 [Caerostris extrusa]
MLISLKVLLLPVILWDYQKQQMLLIWDFAHHLKQFHPLRLLNPKCKCLIVLENEVKETLGNFVPSSQAMDNCSFDDLDNTLLDPNTPIEPNSILGLIASMAAASTNNEIPLYNKPKL